jgi:hypothetical protein
MDFANILAEYENLSNLARHNLEMVYNILQR